MWLEWSNCWRLFLVETRCLTLVHFTNMTNNSRHCRYCKERSLQQRQTYTIIHQIWNQKTANWSPALIRVNYAYRFLRSLTILSNRNHAVEIRSRAGGRLHGWRAGGRRLGDCQGSQWSQGNRRLMKHSHRGLLQLTVNTLLWHSWGPEAGVGPAANWEPAVLVSLPTGN